MNKIRKYFAEPTNIYESLSPFYYTLKLFGLASYNLNFKNGKMKTSIIHYIMMMCFIALYLSFIVNFLQVDVKSYSPEGKSILMYGLAFVYNFQYITILLFIIYNFLKRRNVEKFLKYLETFDDHCEKMGWKFKINHEKNYWSQIFWIVLSIILLIVVAMTQIYWVSIFGHDLIDFIFMFIYCFSSKALVLTTLQFVFGVHCVASRFEILNESTK